MLQKSFISLFHILQQFNIHLWLTLILASLFQQISCSVSSNNLTSRHGGLSRASVTLKVLVYGGMVGVGWVGGVLLGLISSQTLSPSLYFMLHQHLPVCSLLWNLNPQKQRSLNKNITSLDKLFSYILKNWGVCNSKVCFCKIL